MPVKAPSAPISPPAPGVPGAPSAPGAPRPPGGPPRPPTGSMNKGNSVVFSFVRVPMICEQKNEVHHQTQISYCESTQPTSYNDLDPISYPVAPLRISRAVSTTQG